MPTKPLILVLSHHERDRSFFEGLEADFNVDHLSIFGNEKILTQVANRHKKAIVLLDADGFSEEGLNEREALAHFLHSTFSQRRVFILSDRRLSSYSSIFRGPIFFQHSIVRNEFEKSLPFISRVLNSSLQDFPFGLRTFFPEGAEGQKLQLKKSSQRKPAVEAVQSFFLKKGTNERIAANVAQAVDELLMNAIFNAPYDSQGVAIRKGMNRTADFEFGKNDIVDLETLSCGDYVGVGVTDRFGTLEQGTVMRILSSDYFDEGYKPKAFMPNAGLGIRGIMDLGLNLIYTSKQGSRTDAMIFFPIVKNYSESKKVAQVISVFGGVSVKSLNL